MSGCIICQGKDSSIYTTVVGLLTNVVLDELHEYLRCQGLQGPLEGQAPSVREDDGCVHHSAVDELREGEVGSPCPLDRRERHTLSARRSLSRL